MCRACCLASLAGTLPSRGKPWGNWKCQSCWRGSLALPPARCQPATVCLSLSCKVLYDYEQMPLRSPPVGILIAVSVPQTGAGGKERKRFVWAVRQAPVAELEAIPALRPLDSALQSVAELRMCVSDRKGALFLSPVKNKYSWSLLPPVWVTASCSQLSDLWRKRTRSCWGLQAARSRWWCS